MTSKLVQEPDIRQQLDIFMEDYFSDHAPMSREAARKRVLALISQTVSSVIGNSEITDKDRDPGYAYYTARNDLRAELRATAKRLLGREV